MSPLRAREVLDRAISVARTTSMYRSQTDTTEWSIDGDQLIQSKFREEYTHNGADFLRRRIGTDGGGSETLFYRGSYYDRPDADSGWIPEGPDLTMELTGGISLSEEETEFYGYHLPSSPDTVDIEYATHSRRPAYRLVITATKSLSEFPRIASDLIQVMGQASGESGIGSSTVERDLSRIPDATTETVEIWIDAATYRPLQVQFRSSRYRDGQEVSFASGVSTYSAFNEALELPHPSSSG